MDMRAKGKRYGRGHVPRLLLQPDTFVCGKKKKKSNLFSFCSFVLDILFPSSPQMTDPVSLFRLILRRPRRRFLLGSTIWTVFAVLWIAVQAPPVDAPRAEPGVLYLPDTAIVIGM